MPSDPTILAFDTSAAHCAAALLSNGRIVLSQSEPMSRGQAERLMPLLEGVLEEAECNWHDLDAIGVGTGPGNFTGIRVSVSAARGLALGLSVPAVGVSGFEASALLAPDNTIPAIAAPRDQVYVMRDATSPALISQDQAESIGPLFFCEQPQFQVEAIARIASERWSDSNVPPAPLYVRPADAALSRDMPPVLLDP
ncbi:MAG: tRNA (adenosine(37)-N6)-threonylcarbamoyltransferase complex dimerization subunit type 1 TsaB [Ruegeria sp.]